MKILEFFKEKMGKFADIQKFKKSLEEKREAIYCAYGLAKSILVPVKVVEVDLKNNLLICQCVKRKRCDTLTKGKIVFALEYGLFEEKGEYKINWGDKPFSFKEGDEIVVSAHSNVKKDNDYENFIFLEDEIHPIWIVLSVRTPEINLREKSEVYRHQW